VSISTWNSNSSSIRDSDFRAASMERRRARSPLRWLMSVLLTVEDEGHRFREAVPFLDLFAEGFAAGFGERVVACAPVVLGGLPVALDPATMLEALERRVERALIDVEASFR